MDFCRVDSIQLIQSMITPSSKSNCQGFAKHDSNSLCSVRSFDTIATWVSTMDFCGVNSIQLIHMMNPSSKSNCQGFVKHDSNS